MYKLTNSDEIIWLLLLQCYIFILVFSCQTVFYHFFQLVLLIYFYYLFTHVSVYSHILVLQRRIHVFLEHGASSNKTILKGRSNSTFLQAKPKCRCFLVFLPKLVNLANNQTNIATYAYLSLVFAL